MFMIILSTIHVQKDLITGAQHQRKKSAQIFH
jgi:hypothetical protein